VEYTEEIAQAAVPVFTAAIAEPLGLDLPQQAQLTAELERFQADGGLWRPRVYAAVAALTLLPAGVRGVVDTQQARAEIVARLADPDYATAMGIKPNSAVIIATMLPEDRLDAYLESFPARDTSTPAAKAAAESVARKEQEQGQWEQDQVTKAEAAGVRVRRTDTGTYEVQDLISGTTLSMATAGEAAATMRHVMLERGLLEEERFLKAADKHIEMMRRGRSIDVTNIETNLLKELEQATADQRDNDVVTIWERADQYRLSIGKEALDRDRLNPDSRNALAGMTVYGHSITSVREGVARSISKVMSGGDSLDLLEEQAENDYREAVHYGQVTKETMKAIIKKLETATGDQYQFVDSDLGVAEAWSRIVRLYATGTQNSKGNAITQGARGDVAQNIRDRRNELRQAEAAIAGGPTGKKASDLVEKRRRLREAEANGVVPGAFAKLREYYDQAKAQLGQVARLMKARDAGQLDDLETMIRQSVGLTEQDTYDSQLTKQMEATEATINPPDSWTSSMSVGSRALPDIDDFAAADTETQMSFAVSPRIYDHNKELRRPRTLVEKVASGYGAAPQDNILYRPDRYYRAMNNAAWADFQEIGYFRPNPESKVLSGGYDVLYAATGARDNKYRGRYILEVNPVEGEWTDTGSAGYVTTAIGSITKDSAIRVFEMQPDGTSKVVLDNIGDQALFDPTEQTAAGSYSVGSRAQPADTSRRFLLPGDVEMIGPTSFSIGAWHGTRAKVDKFRSRYIGTGEGNQMFGHGLYFAERKRLAEHYRDILSQEFLLDGEVWIAGGREGPAATKARSTISRAGMAIINEYIDQGVERVMYELLKPKNNIDATTLDNVREVLERITESTNKGNLYQVELMLEQEDLLDWDKRLDEQGEKIRQLAREFMLTLPERVQEELDDFFNGELESMTGEQLYRSLTKYASEGPLFDENEDMSPPQEASMLLNKAGIAGIRYLDGISRDQGVGTSNYVIFDDKLIKILEENGQPLPPADSQPDSTVGSFSVRGSWLVLGARPGDYEWTPSGLASTAKEKADLQQELQRLQEEPELNTDRITEVEKKLRKIESKILPGPVTHPTQNKPRLDRVGVEAKKILNSGKAKSLLKDLFGVTDLKVEPIIGTWLGNREPSFVIHGDNMTDEQAKQVGALFGFAWAQDATVAGRLNPSATEGTPAYYVGSKKRLSEQQIQIIHQTARGKGLDFSGTTDGKAVQFLFFGEAADLPAFEQSIADIQKAAGLTDAYNELASTDLDETDTYFSTATGRGKNQAWFQATPAGSSLFERIVRDLVAPYAKAIGSEGYRFNVDLFAKRFGLSDEQAGIVADALYPANGKLKSAVPLMEGKVDLGVEGVTTKKGRFVASVTNVVWSLQNWSARQGLIAPGDYSAKAGKLVSQTIVDEVAWHVNKAIETGKRSAIGWYDRALKAAKAIYAQMFSELDVNGPDFDADKTMIFDALLGIASQGNNVTDNSVMAVRVYSVWRKGGMTITQAVEPVTGTFGSKTVAIENNYLKLETLLANNAYADLRKFFNKSDTVGNINAYLKKTKSLWFEGKPLEVEGASAQKVTGWMVFGPKIGSFINNLHGDYTTLTADLWFSRTWNRILGWSFIHAPDLEAEQFVKLRDAMVAEYTNDQSVRKMKKGEPVYWDHGTDVTNLNLSPEEFDQFINDPQQMLDFATRTEEIFRTGAREGQEKTTSYKDKSAVRRAAKTWIENRENIMEAPRGDKERMFQQDVMDQAQKMLKRMGISITIADMQAALWYNEKDLFATLGSTTKLSAPADYEDAARTTRERIRSGTLFERQSKPAGKKSKKDKTAVEGEFVMVDAAAKPAPVDRIQPKEWEQELFAGLDLGAAPDAQATPEDSSASSMSVGPRRMDADVELQERGRARLEQTQRNRQTAGDNFAELAPSIIALGNTNLKQAIMTDRMRELEDKIRGGTITRQLFKQVFRPEYTRTAADWTDEEKAAVNQALAPFIATLEFEDSTKPASKSWRDTEENRINGTNAETSAVSMSIGPRAKLDAVQARLDARLEKDPAARRKIAAEAARRLRKLETDWTTERLTWRGGKIQTIDEPRTKKSLDKEQAFREGAVIERELAARGMNGQDIARSKDSKDYEMWQRFQESKALLMGKGMSEWEATALADFGASKWRTNFVTTIKEVTAIAKAEAAEWRKGVDAKQAKDYSPRASLLRDMRTLDAIVGALPPEIRYEVGGQIKLAGLATDEARADEIARRIDRIAPLLERHLQKEFTASLEKLLERAAAQNAKPGEKMTGKLGPEVQHLMDAVRKAYKLTAAQTEDALAALDSRLADPDITPEQQALAERERELVNLVGGWRPEYTNSGRLDTLGRPIFSRVSEGASAAQMEAAYAAVEETYETGFQEWQAKILAKRLARQAIRDSLMVDTGKTGAAPERDAKALEELGWTAKLKNMFMSLSSFEEMLRYAFGMDSVQAIRLADQEREAAYAYEDAVQAMGELVHAHFTAIGGDSLAGEKIRYALSQKDKTVGKRTLSEMEIMQAALMWQQKDGQRHMLGKLDESNMPIGTWHYDQAWMDEAMAQLSPEGLSTLAFIRAIYAAEYGPLNAMYRARHGVDLPANANYAPVTVAPAQAKAGEMIDPVGGGTTTGSILTPGSLRTRSRTAIAEPDFKDALQVMLAHTKQMEHWKAYYDFAVEAQAVLGNRELGNAVEARAGAQGKLVLRKWIDVFAQGGTRDAGAALTMNVELGSATGRAARMALVGRVGTLMIQSTQLGAAIAEMPSGAYLLRLGKLTSGQLGWKAAMGSSYIQRRMLQAPPIVQQALAGLSSDNPSVVKHTVQRLGTLISGADALFTAGTYAMILDYQMGEAAKLNLTGPAAEAYAHRAAERSVERVAQPTRTGTRSLYENTATNPLAKLGWAFASEARQKVALAAWAAGNVKTDPARAARVAMVVWGVGGLMAAVLRNAWRDLRDDDDDEVLDDKHWKLSELVASTIAGPLTGIPAIGEALQSAIAVVTGGWDSSGNLFSGFGKGVGAAGDLLSGEFLEADEPVEDVMKDAEAVLMMMGLFNENLASASSLAHVVRDGAAVVDGLYDTDKERLMKDAANQRKLEAKQDKAAKAAETKTLTEEQQEALEEEAKNQRKAKKQAAREEAAAKWRAAQ
jgi:hypothetical protein